MGMVMASEPRSCDKGGQWKAEREQDETGTEERKEGRQERKKTWLWVKNSVTPKWKSGTLGPPVFGGFFLLQSILGEPSQKKGKSP